MLVGGACHPASGGGSPGDIDPTVAISYVIPKLMLYLFFGLGLLS